MNFAQLICESKQRQIARERKQLKKVLNALGPAVAVEPIGCLSMQRAPLRGQLAAETEIENWGEKPTICTDR